MTREAHPQPYREISIDNVRTHLAGALDFVPYPAYDEAEIAARRSQAPGVLVAKQQQEGLQIMRTMLAVGEHRLDDRDALDLLAGAAVISAVYSLGSNTTHRSNFKLPYMADETGLRRSANETFDEALTHLRESQSAAGRIVDIRSSRAGTEEAEASRQRKLRAVESKFGHTVGRASFELSCSAVGFSVAESVQAFGAQEKARNRVMAMLSGVREVTTALGNVPPSLAQLAEPLSPLVAFMHKESVADLPLRYRQARRLLAADQAASAKHSATA